MQIGFREWLLLEMPHLRIENCPFGEDMCFIDFHMEKWQLDQGESLDVDWDWNQYDKTNPFINKDRPFIARIKDGWLVSDGISGKFVKEKPPGDYQELPEGWLDYAEIMDERGIQIKAPKISDIEMWIKKTQKT